QRSTGMVSTSHPPCSQQASLLQYAQSPGQSSAPGGGNRRKNREGSIRFPEMDVASKKKRLPSPASARLTESPLENGLVLLDPAPGHHRLDDPGDGHHIGGGPHVHLFLLMHPVNVVVSLHHFLFQFAVHFLFRPVIVHEVLNPFEVGDDDA